MIMSVRLSSLLLQFLLLLVVSTPLLLLGVANGDQVTSCANNGNGDDETCTKPNNNNEDIQQQPSTPANNNADSKKDDQRRILTIENLSSYRADIHYDDGRFGQIVGFVTPNNDASSSARININSIVGHRFFITMHGVREGLVDPNTDEQYFFTVTANEVNKFIIPKEATTSQTRCKDRYPVCKSEANRGECTNNPGWMIVNCCESCEEKEGYGYLIDRDVRCTRERLNATKAAWDVGSLDNLFTRWATEEKFKQFDPHVVSSPGKILGATHDGPWILTFDSFIDDYEIESLLKGAEYGGFERSTDQGKIVGTSGEKEKIISQHRTSSNAWCRRECERIPGVMRVSDRIEHITGIPQGNYESFQILKYEVGEYYHRHHDSSGKKDGVFGHRILTVFLYLNDVEEGGETSFTDLGISVQPKKGRALIWPSVMNDDPDSSDYRMYHEAKAVVKGTKYAANHWVHQYDYKNANLWGCSGSFN